MVPPQGEEAAVAAAWGRTTVDRALRVAGDDFLRKGHTALDCRKTESMAIAKGSWKIVAWRFGERVVGG